MPTDIFDEIATETSTGGDIFDQLAPDAIPPQGISKPQSVWNSLVRGVKTAQSIPDVVLAAGTADFDKPTTRQERRAYVSAMSDPLYQEGLMKAGDDSIAMNRVESLRGPRGKLDTAMFPQRSIQTETVRDLAAAQADIQSVPKSAAQERLGTAATSSEKWAAWRKDPIELTAGIVAESLPASLAGGFAGTLVGGPGVGTALGAGSSSGLMTFASEFLGGAQAQGVDITNPQALEAFLNDKRMFATAFNTAMTKAVIVGGLDAGTAGVAGRWIEPALKQGLQQRVIASAKELALQAGGGASGEAVGQIAAGQQLDPFDIAMEGLAEIATAPTEVAGNIMAKKKGVSMPDMQDANTETMRNVERDFNTRADKPDIFDEVAPTLSQSQSPASPDVTDTTGNNKTPGAVQATSPAPSASSSSVQPSADRREQIRKGLSQLPGAEQDLTPESGGQKPASVEEKLTNLQTMVADLQATLQGSAIPAKPATETPSAQSNVGGHTANGGLPTAKVGSEIANGGVSSANGKTAKALKTVEDLIEFTASSARKQADEMKSSGDMPVTADTFDAWNDHTDANMLVNSPEIGVFGKAHGWKQADYIDFTNKVISRLNSREDAKATPSPTAKAGTAAGQSNPSVVEDTASPSPDIFDEVAAVKQRGSLAGRQRKYPSYTTAQLKEMLAAPDGPDTKPETTAKIKAEIASRESGEAPVKVTPQAKWGDTAATTDNAKGLRELLATFKTTLAKQEKTGAVDDRLLVQVRQLETAIKEQEAADAKPSEPTKDIPAPLKELQNQVTGAIERGEKEPIVAQDAPQPTGSDAKMAAILAKREELKARLRKKLGQQTNLGVDPEVATIAAELAVNYAQEGVVKFGDFARRVKADLPDIWDSLKQYLRGAWATATDISDNLEDVSRDEAKSIISEIDKPNSEAEIKPEASDDTKPDISTTSEGGTNPTESGRNEPAGSSPASDSADVAGSLPETNAGSKSGKRARTGGKRSGSSSVTGGAKDAGGILGSPAAGGAGTNPTQPGDGSAISQPDNSVGRENYWLKDPASIVGGGPKARFKKNQQAIETVQRLIAENKEPGPQDLDVLAAYTGWGAFGQELFNGAWNDPAPKPSWEKEDAWLREHLGEADWKSAQTSIINAHYTDPITVGTIWRAIERMGFKGGRVLEPSVGIGNFFSLMPREVMRNSVLTGIELEQLTGRIAKMLHPKASISIKGYQDSLTADNFYDLVLGNWPFADVKPADRRYNHFSPVLHDYFFLKALDQVRPGGLVVGITSTGTMDKASPTVRRYLAARGELIASFRLPAGTFGDYAGTAVVTDLVILRKRETKLENPTDDWIDTVELELKGGKIMLNKYYQTNPSQIIGTLGFGSGSTKGRAGMMVIAPPNHQEAMEAIATRVPADVFKPWARPEGKTTMIQGVPASARQFAIIQKDGDLYQVQGEQLALLHDLKKWKVSGAAATKKRMDEAVGAIAIRDSYDAMMDAYRTGGDFDAARKQMAAAYAGFKKKHGLVRGSKMIEVMERAGDSGMTSVLNLEDENGKPRAILERNILRKKVPGAASSIEDAYAIQRNRSVKFSVQDVSEIAKRSEADVISRLTELNQIYKAPDGTWQARDEYLADNVRRKLREAQAAQEQGLDMARNIEALQKIQPKDTPYFEIDVRMGANWVGHEDYKDFVVHLIKTENKHVTIERQSTGWRVKINDHGATHSPEALTLWGIPQTPFPGLLNAAMNGTSVVVKVKDSDGNLVPDQKLTEQANGKVDAIREEFQKWIWQDSERIARLSNEYNEANNSMVAPDRDGSHLMLEGLALTIGQSEFDFRKHQKDAVWRGVQDGKAMFGHEVGTGKTFTMAGLAMEGRRLGVFRKPLIFGHNANHASVVADFRKAYPAGKFLHLDTLTPQERSAKLKQIVLDDWDAIVVPHSLIDRFTLREETLNELAAKEIQALEDELMAEIADAGQSPPTREILDDPKEFAKWASYKEGLTTAKQLVKARARIKERIKKKAQESSKEGAVFFEDLGVDAIFVDEAHIFKKIALATRKEIKGLNKTDSGIGFSLSLLTDYVKSRNAGKGTFLFTGTPITNTLNEAYNMMKYVMSSDMADAGIERFDDWFNVFADAATEVEMNDAGIYEAVERLRAFINVPELARMAGRYFDIVLGKDMPEFKPRSSDEGMTAQPEGRPRKQIKPVILEMSKLQLEHLENIRTRYRAWMVSDGKARREIMLEGKDGPLQLSTEASLSALDYRLIDRFAPDWEGSKANAVVGNISTIYHESPETTQMVFMEQGYNDFTDRLKTRKDMSGKPITDADGKVIKDKERVIKFNVLRDMVEKLNAKGIPPEQVAVFANMSLDPIATRPDDILRRVVRVTGAVSKEDISQMMRDKRVRVAFGQTETMGTGVNAQDYLKAMHHVDAPWMPGSLEQRNGRGWRQGNKWNTVQEFRYTVEGSGDGKRWQVLLNKVRFISRFIELLNGEGKGERTLEGDGADAADETDSVASFEATFSAAAGDPRQMLRVALEKKVKNLEIKQSNHFSATWQAGNKVKQIQSDNESGSKLVAKLTKDLEAYRSQVAGKPFEFEIEGTTYTDRDLADAALKATPLQNATTQMGAHGPFKLYLYKEFSHYMEGPSGVRYDMGTRSIASAEATLRSIVTKLENKIAEINKARDSIKGLQSMAETPFSGAEKLESVKRALTQIETEIQASPFPVPSWIRTTAPQGSLFYLKGADGKLVSHDVAAHRWDENGWWILYMDATEQMRPVDYSKVLDEAGRPIFEPVKFVPPPATNKPTGGATPGTTSSPAATEPDEADTDYEGGEMPRESSFMDWLDAKIKATDFDQTKTLEGITGAPVWMTRGALNVALRAVRAAIKAGKSLAEAIRAGVAAIKAKNLKGFDEAEAEKFLEAEARKVAPDESGNDWASLQQRIAEAQTELKDAIRQHMNPPEGMTKRKALAAKNAAHRKLLAALGEQLKQMTSLNNLDAARSPEQTSEMISQTVDLLNSIQDEISERKAQGKEIGNDLTKLRVDLQARLMMLKGWADEQTEAEARKPKATPAGTAAVSFRELESATDPEQKTFGEWWQKIKTGLRYLTSPIPELSLTGENAQKSALFRRGYRLFAVENNRVRKEAAEKVDTVLEPLTKLGRKPASNEALKQYYRLGEALQRAKMDAAKTKLIQARMKVLEEQHLNKDPFNLFRRLVLYRDLWWRATFLKNDQGEPITLPMGLTIDDVAGQLRGLTQAIEQHPDGLAIVEALKRHYALTEELQKSILEHGEIIPESLRNPLYFPHHIIDSWTGRLDRVRPTTEEDFRRYLIAPQGSGKLIQTDYLKAMYLHTADVLAHNARVDLVQKYWQSYDISEQLKEQHGKAWSKPWNIPPGFKVFTPFKKLPLRMDYILTREVLAEKMGVAFNDGDLRARLGESGMVLNVKPEDLHAAMVAGEKIQWALPAEIADALNGIARRESAAANPGLGHAIGLPFRAVNNLWKKAKLFLPWNWIRYEYGNLSTDAIDKVLAADPATSRYLGRAAREVWNADTGEQSPEFKAAVREGVFETITAGEAGELTKLPQFKAFLTAGEARWDKVRTVLESSMRGSKFRESVFRYAKFLVDVERLRSDKHPVYAGAFHGDIVALGEDSDGIRKPLSGDDLIFAKAAEISLKTYGDYNSLSVAGQWLRQYAVPFWSWQDVNFRYHANQIRNIADGIRGVKGATDRQAALRYAGVRVVTTLLAVGIAKELWNQFGGVAMGLWDDDDDLEASLSEADRRRGHIIVGKDKNGQAMVVYTPSAWSDVAEWMGGQNMKRLFMEWSRGQITLGQFISDFAKQLPKDTFNKAAQSVGPMGKAPYELASNKATFPDILDQRSIPDADRWWRLVGTLTDDRAVNVLRSAFDKDYYSQPASEQLQQIILQVRRRDPLQWAYFEAREDAADWKEARTGKRFEAGSYNAPEAQALRNFRKSIYRGDVARAERFYSSLLDYGYTAERLDASIRNQHPLSDLNVAERADYTKTLTERQQRELALATKYYNRLSALDGREKQLFPKKGQQPRPNPELLKRIVTEQKRD